ncbi:hypothetical protein ACFLU5_09430 [Bacteroidota bacterium]
MVTIISHRISKNAEGEEFVSLILEGDITMIQSQETGNWYATAKRASITSTFTEDRAKKLVGQELPGSIIREECEPYLYAVPETGEEIELSHTYKYVPSSIPVSAEAEVFA